MLKSALTAIPTVFVLLCAHVTAKSLDSTANQEPPVGLVGNYRGGACDFDEFTRAIAGALSGAIHGVAGILPNLRFDLQDSDSIHVLANRYHSLIENRLASPKTGG